MTPESEPNCSRGWLIFIFIYICMYYLCGCVDDKLRLIKQRLYYDC